VAGLRGRLALRLRVHLGAEQDREAGQEKPEDQHDHPGERAVRLAVRAELRHVEREAQ
jgi:hypothetical protein